MNMSHVGNVLRHVNYSDKRKFNTTLLDFFKMKGVVMPKTHSMTILGKTTGLKSVAKYDRCQPKVSAELWRRAGEFTYTHFFPYMGNSNMISKSDSLRELDRTTSCGYPHSLHFSNKRGMLEDCGLLVNDNIIDSFDDSIEQFSKLSGCHTSVLHAQGCDVFDVEWELNKRVDMREYKVPIWTVSQKYEMRTKEKIEQGKVRTFTASPIEHTVCLNRFCLDQNNKFYDSNNKTWSFVGGSKYCRGFHDLYNRLSYHCVNGVNEDWSMNAFALDETDYDASLCQLFLEGQRDLRWEFLAPKYKTVENKTRFWNLYTDVIHSVMVLENGELVQKHGGNPSGCANTIVDNTMVLYRLLAYAWIALAPIDMVNYQTFTSNVEAALNGDDNTFTVSPRCVKWFNAETVAQVWSTIGVKTKSEFPEATVLDKLTFLSHGFKNLDGIWYPIPNPDKILCSLYCASDSNDVRWHILRACALKIEAFADVELRNLISEYITYLVKTYSHLCVGVIKGISWIDIQAMIRDDNWMRALYTGTESAQCEMVSFIDSLYRKIWDVNDGTDMNNIIESFVYSEF